MNERQKRNIVRFGFIRETKVGAHESKFSRDCSIFGFFLPKSRKKCLLLPKKNI